MHETCHLSLSVLWATVTPTDNRYPSQEEADPLLFADLNPGGKALGTLPQAFPPWIQKQKTSKCWVVTYMVCSSQNGLLKIWI